MTNKLFTFICILSFFSTIASASEDLSDLNAAVRFSSSVLTSSGSSAQVNSEKTLDRNCPYTLTTSGERLTYRALLEMVVASYENSLTAFKQLYDRAGIALNCTVEEGGFTVTKVFEGSEITITRKRAGSESMQVRKVTYSSPISVGMLLQEAGLKSEDLSQSAGYRLFSCLTLKELQDDAVSREMRRAMRLFGAPVTGVLEEDYEKYPDYTLFRLADRRLKEFFEASRWPLIASSEGVLVHFPVDFDFGYACSVVHSHAYRYVEALTKVN